MKKYQIQPDYFKDFQCIASRCSDSCCIGWEIDIDKETMDYYNSVEGEFGSRLKSCIEKGSPEEEPHFRLKGERCPFLNQKNLCDIYIELGKEHLCEICSEHPRFYQWFPGSTETGLGLCCEAAGRLILDKKEPVSFETVCLEEEGEPEEEITGILRKARDAAVKVLQDRKRNIYERLLVFIQMTEELQDGLEFSSPAAFDGAHDAKRSQKGEYGAWLLKWYRQMISFLETLEPIDEGWQDYLKGLKGKLSEIAEKREDFRNAFADKMYE